MHTPIDRANRAPEPLVPHSQPIRTAGDGGIPTILSETMSMVGVFSLCTMNQPAHDELAPTINNTDISSYAHPVDMQGKDADQEGFILGGDQKKGGEKPKPDKPKPGKSKSGKGGREPQEPQEPKTRKMGY